MEQDGSGKIKRGYTTDTLIYSPMNPRVDSRWGFSPVEQMITTLAIAANRQTFFKNAYETGNVPEGFLPMPESWSANQIKEFQTWFDSMLAGNLARRRRLIMIPDTKRPAQFPKLEALTDTTDEYLIRVVAFAFGVSPSNLVKQVGHQSTNKEQTDTSQEEGLEPVLKHIEVEFNRIIQRTLGADDVEFKFSDAQEIDPLKKSQVDVAYVNAGIYTRDEVREANGDDPLGVPEGGIPGITTMQGFVPLDQPTQTAGAAGGGDAGSSQQTAPANRGTAKLAKAALKIVGGDLTPGSRQARQEARRVLGRFLKDQGMRVAKQASAGLKTDKAAPRGTLRKDDGSQLETDTDRALVILAAIQWDYPTLYRALLPYLEIAAEEGAKAGAYQMAANRGANLTDTLKAATEKARAAADDRAAQMVGLEVQDDGTIAEATGAKWAISETAKDDVLASIKQAIREEWTPDQLEAVIQAATIFSTDHADLIADNEIGRQQANGHLQSWSASGAVLEYAWHVADLGCCPLCASFSLLGSVPVGYEFAPMIYAPLAHPDCRCELVATKFAEE